MSVSASELAPDAGSTRGRLEHGASLSSSLLKWEAVVFTVWVGAGPGEGALGAAGTAAGLEAGCRKTGGGGLGGRLLVPEGTWGAAGGGEEGAGAGVGGTASAVGGGAVSGTGAAPSHR